MSKEAVKRAMKQMLRNDHAASRHSKLLTINMFHLFHLFHLTEILHETSETRRFCFICFIRITPFRGCTSETSETSPAFRCWDGWNKTSGTIKSQQKVRRMKNATNQMLCWNSGSSDVALVPWPDYAGASDRFECTGLACNNAIREMTFEQRKMAVFVEAVHLIVRDGVDPKALHAALLGLPEYRDGLADDMPRVLA